MSAKRSSVQIRKFTDAEDEDSEIENFAAGLIWALSHLLIVCTFPFSLFFCIKMVQVSFKDYFTSKKAT
jgi:hypothetical protein